MKKFSVKPRIFQTKEVLTGAWNSGEPEWVFLGRLAESGQLTQLNFDLASPHVVAVFGKRGSGKSYTLGSFLEGLCTKERQTSISKISRTRGVLLFDTLGIFQWINIPLSSESPQEIIREQYAAQRGWPIQQEPLDVQIWIPKGTKKDRKPKASVSEANTTPEEHQEFTINSSDFSASDWGYLLGLDIFQDRMGQLLHDCYMKVTEEGWTDGNRRRPPKLDYSLDDLIECVKHDEELQTSYQSETRRAVAQQLMSYKRNPLFEQQGTPLNSFLQPGKLCVVVMNKMSDELRLVVITAFIRRIIAERIDASEYEKHLKILPNLSEQERLLLKQRLADALPPSWIVIDEAQNAMPAERKTTATDVLVKLVREGRNYGLSFMVATQQPLALDPRILAQVDTIIAHKLTVQTDIDYVRRNLKSSLPEEIKYGNTVLSFDDVLRSLDVGQAFVSNTETERAFLLDIRPRISVHGGF